MQGQDILHGNRPFLLNILTSPLCVSFIGTDKAFKPLSRMLLPFQRTLRITKEISTSVWGALGPYDLCA